MANVESHISEDAVRLRSYQIWQREGCPHGNALEHWTRAIAELEAELSAKTPPLEGQRHADPPPRKPLGFVVPRAPISSPPCRSIAMRIAPERRVAS